MNSLSRSPGTFLYYIRDSNGCTSSFTASISDVPAISAFQVIKSPLCHDQNGTVAVFAYGGSSPYLYSVAIQSPFYLFYLRFASRVSSARSKANSRFFRFFFAREYCYDSSPRFFSIFLFFSISFLPSRADFFCFACCVPNWFFAGPASSAAATHSKGAATLSLCAAYSERP